MDYRERFSKRLVQLREQRGITQQELADKLEITRQSLSLYEKAERTINIELLAKVADFFDVSTDYLMGRTDVSSMNEDIQTACKITRLSEDAIKNINRITDHFLSSKIADDITRALDTLINNLDGCMLCNLDMYCIKDIKISTFLIQIVKKFISENNLEISETDYSKIAKMMSCKDIDGLSNTLGEYSLAIDLENFYEKYKKYSSIDTDLNSDLEYEEFKINKSFSNAVSRVLSTYYDKCSDINKLSEYYLNILNMDMNSEDFKQLCLSNAINSINNLFKGV